MRGVAAFMSEHWLWFIVPFVLVAIAVALGKVWVSDRKVEAIVGLGAIVLAVVIVPQVWVLLTNENDPVAPSSPPVRAALPSNAPDVPRAWNPDGSQTDTTKWPRVVVPPHGRSVLVPNIAGGHAVWGGSGFKVRCVYGDGHEGVVGEGTCNDGDIVGSYAVNQTGVELYASYAYARQGEK